MTKLRIIKTIIVTLIAMSILTGATGCFYDRDHGHDDHHDFHDDHR